MQRDAEDDADEDEDEDAKDDEDEEEDDGGPTRSNAAMADWTWENVRFSLWSFPS